LVDGNELTMRSSNDRILTTHVGSLPRNEVLSDLLIREEAGEAIDKAELARQSEAAVRHVVQQQVASGVDVVNDGEQPRVGFQTYVAQRMQGFGGESSRSPRCWPSIASASRGAARSPTRRRRSPTCATRTSDRQRKNAACSARRWAGWARRRSTPS
jgi:5-methyltetrahydropteroyltriglutamate--homocysteine methyltransferase